MPLKYLDIFTTRGTAVSKDPTRPEDAEKKTHEDAIKASPAAHLLSSNRAPSDDEVKIVHAYLAEIEEEIEELTALPKPSEKQKQRISTLEWTRTRHASALSSMRRLPTEVLQHILGLSLAPLQPFSADLPPGIQESSGRAISLPFEYLTVCRHWYNISLSSPELWSILPPIPLSEPFTRKPLFIGQLKKILQLSGGSPLLFLLYEDGNPSATFPHPVVDILADHAERWYFARLKIFPHRYPALSGVRGRLLSLEKLQIGQPRYIGTTSHDRDGEEASCNVFEGAPRLRHFQTGVLDQQLGVSLTLCPVQTYLHSSPPLPPRILSRVQSFAGTLEVLSISDYSFTVDAAISYPHVELPALRRLRISFPLVPSSRTCLQFMATPALEIMSFSNFSPNYIPHFIKMLERSGSPSTLNTLSIHGTKPRKSLLPIFKAVPSLTFLETWLPPFDDIRCLLESETPQYDPPLLPHLQTLLVHFEAMSRHITFEYHAFNLLVQERSKLLKKHTQGTRPEKIAKGRKGRGFEMEVCFPSILWSRSGLLGCYRQRCDLEGWSGVASQSDRKMVEALALAKRLEEVIPELTKGGDAWQLDAQLMKAPEGLLLDVFHAIEALEVDPKVLFVSD